MYYQHFKKTYKTPNYINSSGLNTAQNCVTLYYCVWYHEAPRTILKILLIIITGRAMWLCS